MMQFRQPSSAARWNSRASGQLPTSKVSLQIGTSVIQELETMAGNLNLGDPAYKFAGGTSSGRGYFCSVNIHGHQAGSLVEYSTQEQAKCAAASHAITILKTYYAEKLMAAQHFGGPNSLASSSGGDSSQKTAADVDLKNQTEQGTNSGDDFEHVAENLLDLLASMPRGIYSHALSLKYLETFKQNLPSDWLARIKEGYPEFVVDEVDAYRSIVAKRRVKGPPKVKSGTSIEHVSGPSASTLTAAADAGDDSGLKTSKEAAPAFSLLPISSKKEETQEVLLDKAAAQIMKVRFCDKIDEKLFKREPGEEEHEIIQPPPFAHPPPFTIPEGDYWNVFVSVVKSPADFVVRVLGEEYSEQYEQLQRDMQKFYELEEKGEKLSASSSFESLLGGVFAARAEECWHRVYLNEIIPADEGIADEGVMASVYFIDHGDYETIPLDDLRKLEQKFMRLPCQAVPACLSSFEHVSPEDFTPGMIDRFRDITLAKVLSAKYVKNLDTAAAVGDAGSGAIGPLVLMLAMPLESENPNSAEAGENESETTTESKNPSGSSPPLLVNEVIMQIAPKPVMHKIVSRQAQNGSGTPAAVNDQRP